MFKETFNILNVIRKKCLIKYIKKLNRIKKSTKKFQNMPLQVVESDFVMLKNLFFEYSESQKNKCLGLTIIKINKIKLKCQ